MENQEQTVETPVEGTEPAAPEEPEAEEPKPPIMDVVTTYFSRWLGIKGVATEITVVDDNNYAVLCGFEEDAQGGLEKGSLPCVKTSFEHYTSRFEGGEHIRFYFPRFTRMGMETEDKRPSHLIGAVREWGIRNCFPRREKNYFRQEFYKVVNNTEVLNKE